MAKDVIEKARQIGDETIDKKTGKAYVWAMGRKGKPGWQLKKDGKKTQQPTPAGGGSKKQGDDTSGNNGGGKPSDDTAPKGGKKELADMSHQELLDYAKQAHDDALANVVNLQTAPTKARQVAYDTLKERKYAGLDKLDTKGLTVGYQSRKSKAQVQYKQAPAVEIDMPSSWRSTDRSGKPKQFTAQGQAETYEELFKKGKGDLVVKILNNKKGNPYARHIAYEVCAANGITEDKIDVSGTLQDFWDAQETKKNMTGQNANTDDDDEINELGGGASYELSSKNITVEEIEDIMKEFPGGDDGWMNPDDSRVKKLFNNMTSLNDRQRYDAFVDYQKRQDENYVPPMEQIQDLNAEYLDFLDGSASSFLISAGGAGVGKTWGFKKLCELLNLQQFEPKTSDNPNGMEPGDPNYDWVAAPNIKSEKQLCEFLKQHNGKTILFDDNDAILTRADMKAVMKTVNDNDPNSRLFKDPDTGQMIKFTGKIACITNKSLDSLASDEDGKAVVSRAKKLEVKMTVNENLEILEQRYMTMNIDGLELKGEEAKKARKEAYQFILANRDKLDPAKFTVRKFRDIMLDIQKEKRRGTFGATSKEAGSLVGTKNRGWQKVAMATLNKAQDDEISKNDETESEENGNQRPTERVKKKIAELKKKNPKAAKELFGDEAADNFDSNSLDDSKKKDDDTEEAEKALMDDFNMGLEEAENLLLD